MDREPNDVSDQQASNAPSTAGPPAGGLNLPRVFVVFGMLLAAATMVARDLADDVPAASANRPYQQARALVDQEAGRLVGSTPVAHALEAGTELRVSEKGASQREVRAVRRVDGTPVASVVAVQAVRPALLSAARTAADLPRLSADARTALARQRALPRLTIEGHRRLADRELDGLIVLAPGAELELEDVVLRGALVSASALDEGAPPAFARAPRTTVELAGVVRIDPLPALDGLAVLLSDGALRAGDTARLQIGGDVVAQAVELSGAGSVLGQVAAVGAPRLGDAVDHVVSPRASRSWSSVLDLPAEESGFIAFLPAATTWDDVRPLTSFQFP